MIKPNTILATLHLGIRCDNIFSEQVTHHCQSQNTQREDLYKKYILLKIFEEKNLSSKQYR